MRSDRHGGSPNEMPGAALTRTRPHEVRVALWVEPRPLVDLIAHARDERPRECCGLLIGRATLIRRAVRARNLAEDPHRYLIDPSDHFRAIHLARGEGLAVIGAYHSHPDSPALPSDTDLAEADDPDFVHLIVSLVRRVGPVVRAYRLSGNTCDPVRLVRPPGRA